MRSLVPVCALLILGCSEAPPAVDAGTDAPVALDAGADAGQLSDVPLAVDASAPRDAGADAPDAVAVPDAAREDAVDVQLLDVVDVAVAVPDAPVVDATEDAARDAGMVDAGPTVYALDPPPAVTDVRVLYARTCASADGGACDLPPVDTALMATCSRVGTRLSFDLRACQSSTCFQVTGAFPDYRSAAGASIALVSGLASQGSGLRIAAGAVDRGRQSFHVQFRAEARAGAVGATGVPGRTVDPELADLWLLGCEVR